MDFGFLLISIFIGLSSATQHEYGQVSNDPSIPCLSKDIKDPIRKNGDGVCECDEGLFRHDSQNRCVAPPGEICTVHSSDGLPIRTCSDYSICWSEVPIDISLPRQNGTCICEQDARLDAYSGVCKLTKDSNRCGKMIDCSVRALLTCRYAVCQCQEEQWQTFNWTSSRCEALVGGACGIAKPPFPAAECHGPNMKCVDNKCACEEDYVQTFDKKCNKLTKTTHICQAGGGGGGYGYKSGFKAEAVALGRQEDEETTEMPEEAQQII